MKVENGIPAKRGIYLVANLKSELLCANLIHSIRKSGCSLPIRLIPFGGAAIESAFIKEQVEIIDITIFPKEAQLFVNELQDVLTNCPRGYLLRFLAWFGDWEEFIYSDNDIVALSNWELLFEHLADYDLVHADKEYTTHGKFNYYKPHSIDAIFGQGSLDSIFTAGHFVARRDKRFIDNLLQATEWFRAHPDIPIKHDQALMHIASLLGQWKILNLCKPPYHWLSSWAGDYGNSLELIQALQKNSSAHDVAISHIHYSGRTPSGTHPIDELLYARATSENRLKHIIFNGCLELSGISYLLQIKHRLVARIKEHLPK